MNLIITQPSSIFDDIEYIHTGLLAIVLFVSLLLKWIDPVNPFFLL